VLACPECRCTGAPAPAGCDVEFDRHAGKPVYKCRWDCKTHKTHQAHPDAAREPGPDRGSGEDPDDLEDLLRDLIVAVDHTTAAGSRLPDDVDTAIDGARRSFSAAWRERSGAGNDSALAAVRDLAAAAAPHQDAWTPELRAALAALAGAGVTGPGETAGDAVT
jgi:hypothetical protein